MRNRGAVLLVLLGVWAFSPWQVFAEGGGAVKAIQTAAKSKAALKLGEIIGTYLIGKAFDEAYKKWTEPDPKLLDDSLIDLQKKNPDYAGMLGTLRRAARTDGTPVSRDEFESLARSLVDQLDHAQLSTTPKLAPTSQWNPSTPPLSLPGYGLGITRFESDLWRKSLITGSLSDPLLVAPRLNFSTLSPKKEESLLAAKLVGAWSFPNRTDLFNRGGGDVYIFHRNGNVTEYKVLENDEIFAFDGKYSVAGDKLTIEWNFSTAQTLTAKIEELDGGHIKYTADKTPLDIFDPAPKKLTRLSDVGHFSVITVNNPSPWPFRYRIRWATVDGVWSPWQERDVASKEMWSTPYQGGFFCQVAFADSSLIGAKGKVIPVSFNVVSSPQDPKVLEEGVYRVEVNGTDYDLVPDTATMTKPGVR